MANIEFNHGQDNSIVFAKYSKGSYYPGWNVCNWMNDRAIPFDIMPFVRAFIDDNSNQYFPLIKAHDRYYGLKVIRQNDIIIVHTYTHWGTIYNDHTTERIFYRPLNNIPSEYIVYPVWMNGTTSGAWSSMELFVLDNERVVCQWDEWEDNPAVVGDETGSFYPVSAFPTYPVTLEEFIPFQVGEVALSATMGPLVPAGCFKYNETEDNIKGYVILCDNADFNLSSALNVDGTAPTPYIPPEPPGPEEPPFVPSDEDPYPPTPPGPDTSDVITIPSNPVIGVTNAGFINVYKTTIGALQGLGDILFPNVASATDVQDAILKVCQALQNQNLVNYIIDCHVLPVSPQVGSNANIKVGFRDTGISAAVVTNDYIDATCGSLSIPEYFHGYQDYIATRSKIYLPFIGFVDTKPEYWQAGTISVDYKFNIIDGSFMCYIRSVSSKSSLNGSVIAQYAGNACMHFPVTGVNYASMVSGIIGSVANAVSKGTASAVLGGAWSAANTFAQGPDVQQSNGYNSTAALMGVREAFLLIERPVPAFPLSYAHDKGYPSNITAQLSTISGYTEIEDIDLSGIPFTETEIEELRGLLKEGVYF